MTCAICMEGEGDVPAKPFTTLECSHCFHVHCALHWFRYENNTCPLCRSRRDAARANVLSDTERIRLLRRKKKTLPVWQRRDLERMDESVAKCRQARGELKRLRTQHKGVFKAERTLQRTIMQMDVRREELHERLVNLFAQGVPYMRWTREGEEVQPIVWIGGQSASGDEESFA